MITEAEKPIPVDELEMRIEEGNRLQFPIHRAYEMNLLNDNWNSFVQDMALKMQGRIADAMARGDDAAFKLAMKHIAGISSMYRLNDASLKGNALYLDLAITDFKDYIGTTAHALLDPDFRNQLVEAGMADAGDPNRYFSNPLATNTNIVTSDGRMPVGIRSNKVAIYPEVPHVIGGYVKVNGDSRPDFNVRDVDLFSFMLKELKQEIGIDDEDITSKEFFGICRNTVTRGPEALYNVEVSVDADELRYRWENKSRDKFEHRNITFYDKEGLRELLEEYRGRMVPSGEASLTMFLKHYG